MLSRSRCGALGGLAVVMSLFVLAANAQASSLSKDSSGRLVWTSSAAVDNDLTINYTEPFRCLPGVSCDPSYRITDPNEAIVLNASGCTQTSGTVLCTANGATPVNGLIVNAGPGNDRVVHDVGECQQIRCIIDLGCARCDDADRR